MTDLSISNELAEQLYEIAEREHRTVEEVLAEMVAQRKISASLSLSQSTLADEDIEVPADIQNKAVYRAAVIQMRPKLYQIARRYWQAMGDQERLALTDEQLDKKFWLIDSEGIPRLKSEQGTVTLPSDPLEALIGLIDDAPTDLSDSVRETMNAHYRTKSGKD